VEEVLPGGVERIVIEEGATEDIVSFSNWHSIVVGTRGPNAIEIDVDGRPELLFFGDDVEEAARTFVAKHRGSLVGSGCDSSECAARAIAKHAAERRSVVEPKERQVFYGANATAEDVRNIAKAYCEAIGHSSPSFKEDDDDDDDGCVGPVSDLVASRVRAARWREKCQRRGLEHSFDPPFFDFAVGADGESNAVVFDDLLSRRRRRRGGRRRRREEEDTTTLFDDDDDSSDDSSSSSDSPILDDSPVLFLEVGSFEGSSATWFAENVLSKHGDSRLLCVDAWSRDLFEATDGQDEDIPLRRTVSSALGDDGALGRFRRNLQKTPGGHQVIGLRGASATVLTALAAETALVGAVDLVYVDGGHDAAHVLEDAVLAFRLLKKGGIMAFDDYGGTATTETRRGIDAFLAAYASLIRNQLWNRYLLAIVKD